MNLLVDTLFHVDCSLLWSKAVNMREYDCKIKVSSLLSVKILENKFQFLAALLSAWDSGLIREALKI